MSFLILALILAILYAIIKNKKAMAIIGVLLLIYISRRRPSEFARSRHHDSFSESFGVDSENFTDLIKQGQVWLGLNDSEEPANNQEYFSEGISNEGVPVQFDTNSKYVAVDSLETSFIDAKSPYSTVAKPGVPAVYNVYRYPSDNNPSMNPPLEDEGTPKYNIPAISYSKNLDLSDVVDRTLEGKIMQDPAGYMWHRSNNQRDIYSRQPQDTVAFGEMIFGKRWRPCCKEASIVGRFKGNGDYFNYNSLACGGREGGGSFTGASSTGFS